MQRLIDTRSAADRLGLRPSTLTQWRWLGKGPRYRKLGAAVRYHVDDIDAWADEQARTSTSDPGGRDRAA